MEPINVNLSCDIQQPVKVRYLDGYFFSKDSAGHRINVDVFNNGVPVSVGGSVSAEVIRSDGETVPVTGAVSENRAYVILPQAVYAVVGAVQITIKVTEGTTIVTIACFVAYVHESDTEITVDPGTIIPSIQALISQIETAVASIPADYSSLWTSLAPAFSTSTAYAVDQYVTNSGVLYRFTTAHPAGTWNSAHVTAVNLGSDISALKGAITHYPDGIGASFGTIPMLFEPGYYTTPASGSAVSKTDSSGYMTAYFPVVEGDQITMNVSGYSGNSRSYVFIDSSGKAIGRCDPSLTGKRTVTAPANAVFCAVNNRLATQSDGYYVYKGEALKDRFENNVLIEGLTATGFPAVAEGAAAGKATVTTSATKLLRYKKNLMTLSGSPSSSLITRDENGAFVINGTPSSNQYINIQKKINLKAGVEYRVDGSPMNTVESTGLCLYNAADERKGYDQDGTGATYTPEEDETVRLRLRLMAGTYNNVKFYPVLCENATAKRFTPQALELLEGHNEVIGFDFAPLTIGYDQSKIALLGDEVEKINEETEQFSDIFTMIQTHANEDGEYDSDFSATIRLDSNPSILTITGQYTGETPPTVRIKNRSTDTGGYSFRTARYVVGGTEEPTRRSWRIPMKSANYELADIEFVIPEGTVLNISNAEIRPDQRNRYNEFGIRFHGHRGSIAPTDTVEAFQLGAELGYTSMIAIPKFTTDEIGVCFHDDNTISGDLCWMDGTSITGSDDKSVTAYSYDELLDFRVKSTRWGLLHIATLDDYFRVCSLTGMNPIFSLHSSAFGPSSWGSVDTKAHWVTGFQKIRALAVKWNVLDKIGIKSGSDTVMKAALEVFGKDIDCYIWLSGQTHDPYNIFSLSKTVGFVASDATDLTGCEYTLKSEYFYTQTVEGASHYSATMTQIADLLSKGYIISVAETDAISGEEMRRLIGVGVTEFTVDSHISMGLYW